MLLKSFQTTQQIRSKKVLFRDKLLNDKKLDITMGDCYFIFLAIAYLPLKQNRRCGTKKSSDSPCFKKFANLNFLHRNFIQLSKT